MHDFAIEHDEQIVISIHALRMEGDAAAACRRDADRISIHALRVEGDPGAKVEISYNGKFLSTPSGWRATRPVSRHPLIGNHFYPRPPGGGRPLRVRMGRPMRQISIHALRVEGDPFIFFAAVISYSISIHALRVEGDLILADESKRLTMNFYPRPPGGGRPFGVKRNVI